MRKQAYLFEALFLGLFLLSGCSRIVDPSAPDKALTDVGQTPLQKSGTTIALDFNTLPSAQGWTYTSDGATETSIFSVSDGILTQNTLAGPYTTESYHMASVISPALPFTVSVRARVIAESGAYYANSFGFGFSAFTGTEIFGIGLGTMRIEDILGDEKATTIDNTQFHDYRLEVTPTVGYKFFVDNTLIATGLPRVQGEPNRILFGDLTRGTGAHAEVTEYTFSQDDKVTICHKPGTPAQKTLVIPTEALDGHLRHGDTIGPCQ